MTQEEAQAIYNTYNGRAGRKPSTYYQAISVLGIEQPQPSKTTKTNSKGNFVYKNDDVSENEKFRYIRIKQIQNLNSTNLTTDAYLLLLTLLVSPNSNSLGAFKISYNEMQVQTAGLPRERITKALNELIMLGEIRYNDGIIFLNNFLSNQKQHGNKDNLIGIIKQYNSLDDKHKLPYLGAINYQQMNMEQVVNSFNKIKKGIECMGVIASGQDVIISDYADVYTQEQIENIIENNIESFAQTIPVVTNNKARLLVVDEPQLDERSIELVTVTSQVPQVTLQEAFEPQLVTDEEQEVFFPAIEEPGEETFSYPTPVTKKEEVQEDEEHLEYVKKGGYASVKNGDNRSNVIPQEEEPQPMVITPQEKEIQPLDDKEIITLIATASNLTEEEINEYINKNEFNYVYRYVSNGGRDFNKIKEMTIEVFSKLRN